MKKLILILITSLIVVCALNMGCSENEKTDGLSGTYNYTGFSSDNVVIITGILQIDASDLSHVTGKWQLSQVGNENNIGPQVGSGNLEGGFTDDVLMLNLNPGWADNNVFLIGRIEDYTFTGTWEYSGFAGIINQGYFSVVKN